MAIDSVRSPRQIALSIQLDDCLTFNNYYAPDNSSAAHVVTALQSLDEGSFVYLWGSEGSGRSHLLQACCQDFTGSYVYLPLAELKNHSARDALSDLESLELVVLDDIDLVCNRQDWAEALFHLYNRLQESRARLIVSAQCAPAEITSALADLRSRLSAMQVFRLQGLSDEEIMRALSLRATLRGFELTSQVAQYLMTHFSRSISAQIRFLDQLDKSTLEAKRKLTVPFVKEILLQNRD